MLACNCMSAVNGRHHVHSSTMTGEMVMPSDDTGDAFSFLDDPDDDSFVLRPKQSKRQSKLHPWFVSAGFLTFHGMLFATFLNFIGIARIPGLERFTRARIMPARIETIPIAPKHWVQPGVAEGRPTTSPLPASPVGSHPTS
jgi:hypothetical protein